ncbi:uncharacterized protein MONBRDRAFT_31280 [Monosiga brevicollis MX1]|uniref:D-serine dehydratase-like domain-containing protein n=1 Tax=Monosiga brevicollis TaxID=81824 RepID=A9USU4_MONBE|nr:uncharacterized protein MONBRDRAFT_31280 [Monosiga brevicollis MX1]EDQ92164.1 predicted protein [Monosiga brevicollis MX1]|eukprot:XP_001743450.1 hypothetical protein [Monosiga brevicollis MX1]
MAGTGLQLAELATPFASVDLHKVQANVHRMQARANQLGVRLRPHYKTHKTRQGASLQLAAQDQPGITVSTLEEARHVQAVVSDVLFAGYPTEAKVKEILALTESLAAFGILVACSAHLNVLFRGLRLASPPPGRPLGVWLDVDSGYHRSGLGTDADAAVTALELVRCINQHPGLTFCGLYTHAGHSYAARGVSEIQAIARQERDALCTLATYLRTEHMTVAATAVGSTPTCSQPPPEGLDGITEMHPGNYIFYDVMQAHIGACRLEDVAIQVHMTITAVQRDRLLVVHKVQVRCLAKNVSCLALKRSWRNVNTCQLFPQQPEEGFGAFIDHPTLRLLRVSQESSVVVAQPECDLTESFAVGQRLRLLPWHSCTIAALHPQLFVTQDQTTVLEACQAACRVAYTYIQDQLIAVRLQRIPEADESLAPRLRIDNVACSVDYHHELYLIAFEFGTILECQFEPPNQTGTAACVVTYLPPTDIVHAAAGISQIHLNGCNKARAPAAIAIPSTVRGPVSSSPPPFPEVDATPQQPPTKVERVASTLRSSSAPADAPIVTRIEPPSEPAPHAVALTSQPPIPRKVAPVRDEEPPRKRTAFEASAQRKTMLLDAWPQVSSQRITKPASTQPQHRKLNEDLRAAPTPDPVPGPMLRVIGPVQDAAVQTTAPPACLDASSQVAPIETNHVATQHIGTITQDAASQTATIPPILDQGVQASVTQKTASIQATSTARHAKTQTRPLHADMTTLLSKTCSREQPWALSTHRLAGQPAMDARGATFLACGACQRKDKLQTCPRCGLVICRSCHTRLLSFQDKTRQLQKQYEELLHPPPLDSEPEVVCLDSENDSDQPSQEHPTAGTRDPKAAGSSSTPHGPGAPSGNPPCISKPIVVATAPSVIEAATILYAARGGHSIPYLILGLQSGLVQVYELSDYPPQGKLIAQHQNHRQTVAAVAALPDKGYLSGSYDGTVHAHILGQKTSVMTQLDAAVHELCVAGARAFIGLRSGHVVVLHLPTNLILHRFDVADKTITSISVFDFQGLEVMLAASVSGTVQAQLTCSHEAPARPDPNLSAAARPRVMACLVCLSQRTASSVAPADDGIFDRLACSKCLRREHQSTLALDSCTHAKNGLCSLKCEACLHQRIRIMRRQYDKHVTLALSQDADLTSVLQCRACKNPCPRFAPFNLCHDCVGLAVSGRSVSCQQHEGLACAPSSCIECRTIAARRVTNSYRPSMAWVAPGWRLLVSSTPVLGLLMVPPSTVVVSGSSKKHNVLALSIFDGSVQWRLTSGSKTVRALALQEQHLFAGGFDGCIRSFFCRATRRSPRPHQEIMPNHADDWVYALKPVSMNGHSHLLRAGRHGTAWIIPLGFSGTLPDITPPSSSAPSTAPASFHGGPTTGTTQPVGTKDAFRGTHRSHGAIPPAQAHEAGRNRNYRLQCRQCHALFESRADLTAHQTLEHNTNPTFQRRTKDNNYVFMGSKDFQRLVDEEQQSYAQHLEPSAVQDQVPLRPAPPPGKLPCDVLGCTAFLDSAVDLENHCQSLNHDGYLAALHRLKPSPYEILNLDLNATSAQVRQRYRDLSRRWHPDRNPQQCANLAFQMFSEAYRTLNAGQ